MSPIMSTVFGTISRRAEGSSTRGINIPLEIMRGYM
jgi:hypothetical protein